MPRVSVYRLRHVARVYAAEATATVPFSEILTRSGIEPDLIWVEDARVEVLREAAVLEQCCAALADQTFAARAGLATQGPKNLSAYLVGASANMGEALKQAQRYYALEDHDLEIKSVNAGPRPVLTLSSSVISPRQYPRHREFILFAMFKRAEQIAGAGFTPISIFIESTDSNFCKKLAELAGCDVEGGQSAYALMLPPDAFSFPIRTSDRALLDHLQRLGDEMLKDRPERKRTLAERISAMVESELPGKVPNGDEVASALGMTRRTLTRRLSDEGTGFKVLVETAQCDMAKRLILRGESIAQVAFLLDFADQAAFSVAFKRWTGATPARFRKSGI